MMTKWQEVKLGNVAKFSQGIQVPIEKQSLIPFENSVRFIRIVDLTNPNEPKRYISNPGERYLISENDLAMVRYGSPGLPVLGMNGAIANNLFRIIPNNLDEIYPKYLFYYFLIPSIQNYLLTVQPSSTMPSITFNVMKNLSISLPPLEVQRKIAGVLDALDDKIELNNKINNNLEQQAQALFKSWFVDFEPFGGKMPKDWQIKTLKEVVTFSQGVQVPVQKQITELIDGYEQFIRIVDLTQNNSDIRFIENIDKGKISYDDIFMIRYGTPGILGRNYKGIIANNLFKIEPINNIISKNYIYNFLNSDFIQNYIKQNAVSSTMPAINFSTLYGQELIIPDAKTLTDYTKIDESMRKHMLQIKFENERLTQLRDTLLPKLMSGEIDVSKVNISADKLSFTEE